MEDNQTDNQAQATNQYAATPQVTNQYAATQQTDHIQTLVPTKNKYSLISYYLGFAAFIPFIGMLFAVGAIIYASKAMRLYNTNPTPGAKGHAMVGRIMGIILLIIHFLAFIFYILPAFLFLIIALNERS